DPGEAGRDVFGLGGEPVLRGEAVAQKRAAVAEGLELLAYRGDGLAAAGVPAPAVGEHDGGEAPLAGQGEGELLLVAAGGIRHVRLDAGQCALRRGRPGGAGRGEDERQGEQGGEAAVRVGGHREAPCRLGELDGPDGSRKPARGQAAGCGDVTSPAWPTR